MKTILVPALTLAICLAVLWKWTLGFSSFTVFTYTLNEAGKMPRAFPDIPLISQDSTVFHISDKKKYVLINFVYLNCPYVCHKVNNQIEKIYHLFNKSTVPSKLEFVTVIFDRKNDDIQKIKQYRSYFGADISGWSFALPYQSNQASFDAFLKEAGIWKYSLPAKGIINHSLYLFLVDPANKVVRVFDPARDSNNKIVEQINACIKKQSI